MRKIATCAWILCACACEGQRHKEPPSHAPAPSASAPSAPAPSAILGSGQGAALGVSSSAPDVDRRYQAYLAARPDLTYLDLERELSLSRKPDPPLSFPPEAARYASLVMSKLALTPEERATFRREGVVNIDHDQRYSMASAYYAIFTRDLPLLVTTDSILHALHRSYDEILKSLETTEFTSTLSATLEQSHDALKRTLSTLTTPKLEVSAGDVDIYLTVARNLLSSAEPTNELRVHSLLGNDEPVRLILRKIAAQHLETAPDYTSLFGGRRPVDYSQFKPRGHYTESAALSRYFQTLIWLGRADTGFVLAPPDKNSGVQADAERELRSAALLALMLEQSLTLRRFEVMGRSIDFLVGSSDSLTVSQLLQALHDAGVQDPSALEASGMIVAVQGKVAHAGRQQIRSQVLTPPKDAEKEAAPPVLFQLFGQRFLLDSFVLSRLVYDSIWFKGQKMERQMPSGLDVMAALGNNEATRLLRPELERFNYSSDLLAARRTVEALRPEEVEQSATGLWLDALRKLDEPPTRPHFPEAMKRTAFSRKELQTQLASWAELRHDTVLYAKQSYSVGAVCEYPEAYVEPYPEFFTRLALLADEAGRRLSALSVNLQNYADFFGNFASTMHYLERLARKELEAQPFTQGESSFLKKTISTHPGCGGPSYSGWYAGLIFGGDPEAWKPTVTDVHTDPTSGQVLEEGVGNANFFALAVDNQTNHTVYVGPVYSYYELTRPASDRMTDEQWQALISTAAPARPSWWAKAFPAKAVKRTLADAGREPDDRDPRERAAQRLRDQVDHAKTEAERQRLFDAAETLGEAAQGPPRAAPR